ncbi:MAG: DUF5103 domain-containing protein [Bacteroidetes bacterium]|nr:DUF5103 domain-containing protein [Bacteroidota bacterium]
MKKPKPTFLFFLCIFVYVFISAGDVTAQSTSDDVVNNDIVYKPFIKTVLLFKEGFEMSAPVILLNSEEKLHLSFDDMDSDLKRYRYTIIHCDADWNTSVDLMQSDYINGFTDDEVGTFEYSYNTTAHYTHFTLLFPNPDMQPRLSGNYLLKVFIDDQRDIAFTRRFRVYEKSGAGVTGEVRQSSAILEKFTRQEVDFTIHMNGMRVSDPVREFRVMITQNDRQDNALRNIKPKFTRGNELDFMYDETNTFNGGNEFRSFDIKSLVYQTERIRKIAYDSAGYEVYLLDDQKRPRKNYVSDKEINGRKLIRNEELAKNSDIEADYAWVHFFLVSDPLLDNNEVYILGALTDWQLDNGSKMRYDPVRKGYEKQLYLKQGYYNYIYVIKDPGTGKFDETPVEGNHWETENVYTIWVYYRETGGLYDRLIALQNLNSNH